MRSRTCIHNPAFFTCPTSHFNTYLTYSPLRATSISASPPQVQQFTLSFSHMNKALQVARLARSGYTTLLSRTLTTSTLAQSRLLTSCTQLTTASVYGWSTVAQKGAQFAPGAALGGQTTVRAFSTAPGFSSAKRDEYTENSAKDAYSWIDEEARELIAKAYQRHKALADKSEAFPPSLSVVDLEKIGTPYHYEPRDFVDRCAHNLMKFLRVFVHGFFREKYDHHAVCLETVAAVPGIVGSFHRHLRSLRRMHRDHGWITVLQEEAENERMHLLIFMKVCKPTLLERGLVIVAQGMYLTFYSTLYLLHSRAAHRLTGYLEEEAHRAYTDYLASIDSGKIPNRPAPSIAKEYYRLPDTATMRDVILHVRADEAMHRDVNHHFGDKYGTSDIDSPPRLPHEK